VTVLEALAEGRRQLTLRAIPEATLESEILLRHVLGVSSVDLFLRHNDPLSPEHEETYLALIRRRLAGEPSAYLTGKREFYGNTFYVNPSVLIPRPETELLVSRALEVAGGHVRPIIVDIGTGCGAIAITIAQHLPQAVIYALDISPEALLTAQDNAHRHNVAHRITFLEGDLLFPLPEAADVIAANLPYIASHELPSTGEPRLALDGGESGLDVITRLIRGLPPKLKPGAQVLLEIGQGQEAEVCRLLRQTLRAASVQIFCDLAGIARLVQATLLDETFEGEAQATTGCN